MRFQPLNHKPSDFMSFQSALSKQKESRKKILKPVASWFRSEYIEHPRLIHAD